MTIAELRKKRAAAYDAYAAVANKETITDDEKKALPDLEKAVTDADDVIERAVRAQELAAKGARPVEGGQDGLPGGETVTPAMKVMNDAYEKEKSLVIGGVMKVLGHERGSLRDSRDFASKLYGENHPVTKALVAGTGSAGGFIVPPDYMAEIIPLLRAQTVVRAAGPRNIPMPRGTMTLPGQSAAASASYGSEIKAIPNSQQKLSQIVASYKKLTALVPVSNDMMRYADPAVDAFVRDDLVAVMALREDLAFLLGDGTADTPRGYLSFANGWVAANSGTVGVWSTSANSVYAVNGTDPANSTGGNFITSNSTYTLTTVAQELGGCVNRLDTANVPDNKRVWFMHPRSYNYLFNVQNSLGVYVYRDELSRGTLLGYPIKKTTAIGNSYWDTSGTNKDLSFVFLTEMTEDMILDSMQLELAVSREGVYVDSVSGGTVSAFQSDLTIIRAIAEHDHQLRHDQSVACIQAVRWAPAIS